MTSIFLAGFCLGMAALWIFLELISMRRRVPPVTMHYRKYRDAPERRVPQEVGERGIDYKFLGMGDREDVR